MLDITDELKALVNELNRLQIEYALCGGLAMGFYGRRREGLIGLKKLRSEANSK